MLTSLAAIPAEDWSALAAPRLLFETRDWLLANEGSLGGDSVVTAEYDDSGGDNRALRSLIVWRALDAADPSPYYNITALLTRLADEPPPVPDGWTLNCTGSGMHSPMLAAPGVQFTADRVQGHISAAGRPGAPADEPPAAVGFNFLPRTPPPGLTDALAELGFLELRGYRRAVLELPSGGYDDYLASLSSRQRWSARRDRRRYAESGQRISIATGPGAAGDDLIRLQGFNRLKYGLPHDEEELRAKHDALLRCVGDDGVVVRSSRGDASTGFAMFFGSGTVLHALFAGFEQHTERTGPYFECLFHAAIEWACEHGIEEIDYGIGSAGAKAERGCRIDEVSTWYSGK